MRYRVAAASGLALLATACPTCGRIRVFWDGAPVSTVDLRARRLRRSVIVPVASFGSVESGRVLISVTSTAEPVTIDGLVVFKSPSETPAR